MNYLLDTHFLIWIPAGDPKTPATLLALLSDPGNEFFFSAASLWEIAIKHSAGKANFPFDARGLRTRLLHAGFQELPVLGEHALAVEGLEPIHKDPFDRLLIAQAIVEGIVLLTVDRITARYAGPIRLL